jgi:GNAT superfamily N-acetyltransferase
MSPADAVWVNENYRNIPEELDYVRLLLEKGLITGAYVGGRCAGFIGRHSEGSIGLLEVLPEFRRRGIAEALLSDAINRELALGHIPFGQVVWDNGPSLALQKKVGSEISEGHLYWMDLAERR